MKSSAFVPKERKKENTWRYLQSQPLMNAIHSKTAHAKPNERNPKEHMSSTELRDPRVSLRGGGRESPNRLHNSMQEDWRVCTRGDVLQLVSLSVASLQYFIPMWHELALWRFTGCPESLNELIRELVWFGRGFRCQMAGNNVKHVCYSAEFDVTAQDVVVSTTSREFLHVAIVGCCFF